MGGGVGFGGVGRGGWLGGWGHKKQSSTPFNPSAPHLFVVLEEAADLREAVRGQLADVGVVLELRVVAVDRDQLGGGRRRVGQRCGPRSAGGEGGRGQGKRHPPKGAAPKGPPSKRPACLVVALPLVKHLHHADGLHAQEAHGHDGLLGGDGGEVGRSWGTRARIRGSGGWACAGQRCQRWGLPLRAATRAPRRCLTGLLQPHSPAKLPTP